MTERTQETAQNLTRLVEQSVNTLQEVDRRLQTVRTDLAALIAKASELQAQGLLGQGMPQGLVGGGLGSLGQGAFGAPGPGAFGSPYTAALPSVGTPYSGAVGFGPWMAPSPTLQGPPPGAQGGAGPLRGAAMPVPRTPQVDLLDAGNEFRLQVELPGVKKEDLDIMVSERTVTVSGQVKPEPGEGTQILAERMPTVYRRMIPLPVEVNTTQSKATFKDGVLTLTVPKKSPGEGPRRVDVAYG